MYGSSASLRGRNISYGEEMAFGRLTSVDGVPNGGSALHQTLTGNNNMRNGGGRRIETDILASGGEWMLGSDDEEGGD